MHSWCIVRLEPGKIGWELYFSYENKPFCTVSTICFENHRDHNLWTRYDIFAKMLCFLNWCIVGVHANGTNNSANIWSANICVNNLEKRFQIVWLRNLLHMRVHNMFYYVSELTKIRNLLWYQKVENLMSAHPICLCNLRWKQKTTTVEGQYFRSGILNQGIHPHRGR